MCTVNTFTVGNAQVGYRPDYNRISNEMFAPKEKKKLTRMVSGFKLKFESLFGIYQPF